MRGLYTLKLLNYNMSIVHLNKKILSTFVSNHLPSTPSNENPGIISELLYSKFLPPSLCTLTPSSKCAGAGQVL